MTTIKQLTIDDYRAVLDMQTGVEDDYVLRIFPQLIENPAQTLFGLVTAEGIAALAGVYRLPNGNGVLGRCEVMSVYIPEEMLLLCCSILLHLAKQIQR